MKSVTLKKFMENYQFNLQSFLNQYEDNSEILFLRDEYLYYVDYFNVLISISNLFKRNENEKLKTNSSQCFVCEKLKEINIESYQKVFNNNLTDKVTLHNVDKNNLDNLIKSAREIIRVINVKENQLKIHNNYPDPNKDKLVSNNQTNSKELDDLKKLVNPYPQIFSNIASFNLFERLYEQFKDSKNQLADFSFIYRMMFNDGYILSHFKPQMFIDWIDNEPYKISLDKIKTMRDCSTEQKMRTYSNTKEIIQIK